MAEDRANDPARRPKLVYTTEPNPDANIEPATDVEKLMRETGGRYATANRETRANIRDILG